MKSLSDLKILDLSTRLPGPLACNQLAKLGASVTKIEWNDSPDPFYKGDGESDPIFRFWYDNFNKEKEIKRLDFDSYDKSQLDQYDLIIYSPKKRYKNFFGNNKRIAVKGGKSPLYLHDLNALALSRSFELNTGSLPHLPFAGIIYAQEIALKAIALLMDKNKSFLELYLSDISYDILDKFYSSEISKTKIHLHNGAYPCYQIYRSADNKLIAFAAVETKFWQKFSDLFNLNLEMDDRFDTSLRVQKLISHKFQEHTLEQIKEIINDEDICITYLPH